MKWPRLPGYRRRKPDPISRGVMTPPPFDEKLTRRYIKEQRRLDHKFWALINDHNWLQYHPTDHRLRTIMKTPWRRRGGV
jgi:hypothetical protein